MTEASYKIKIDKNLAGSELIDSILQVEVEDNGLMADIFRLKIPITMLSNGDWSLVSESLFNPQTEVEISVKVDDYIESLIKGYVTDHRIHFDSDPGISYIEVIGMDSTCLMNLKQVNKEWSNMSDSSIASTIFSDYGFTPDVEQTQPVHSDIKIIQRTTDIQFLRMLARRNGLECYLQSDPNTGMVTGCFKKPKLDGTTQKDLAFNFGSETNVEIIDISYSSLKPTEAKIQQIDIKSKSTKSFNTQSCTLDVLGKEKTLDMLKEKPNVLLRTQGANTDAELKSLCEVATNVGSWAIIATGEVDFSAYKSILHSNRIVLLKGAGSVHSGTYYISRVHHILSPEKYKQRFEIKRNALKLKGNENFETEANLAVST
jgi:phage protein D